MTKRNEIIDDFLAQKRIAVAGVSRQSKNTANFIYRKLRNAGYEMAAINPNAKTVEGDPCYPDVQSVPEKVDGVVIVTRPEVSEAIVHQCAEAGVARVWMHRSLGNQASSVSKAAVQFCREHGIQVIAGGCPMMFCEPVDFGHKCIRWIAQLTGGVEVIG